MRRLWICCLALCLSDLACSAAGPITLEVSAGKHARKETPVRWDLPAGKSLSGDWKLVRADGGKEVAMQTDSGGVTWILDEELAAGAKRTYRLEPGTPANAPSRVTFAESGGKSLIFRVNGKDALCYNFGLMTPPEKVEPLFARSGYVHPIWSPSGKIISDDFPLNHKHHHGLWLTWSQTVFEGRPTNFWEQFRLEGKVECAGVDAKIEGPVFGGFRARHKFTDLKAPAGPKPVLDDAWDVKLYALDKYYLVDFLSTEKLAGDSPLFFKEYRYGGLGFRGAAEWDGKDGCAFLTSEGKTRVNGHATKANWCEMNGKVKGETVGIGFFCHPSNFRAPEGMRIHDTEPFFNFVPCQGGDFEMRPGEPFVLRYRLFIHEGAASAQEMDRLWRDYAEPPEVKQVGG